MSKVLNITLTLYIYLVKPQLPMSVGYTAAAQLFLICLIRPYHLGQLPLVCRCDVFNSKLSLQNVASLLSRDNFIVCNSVLISFSLLNQHSFSLPQMKQLLTGTLFNWIFYFRSDVSGEQLWAWNAGSLNVNHSGVLTPAAPSSNNRSTEQSFRWNSALPKPSWSLFDPIECSLSIFRY